ncbi:MAG: dioxygenase family protein [Bdellovibrionota bacterium]
MNTPSSNRRNFLKLTAGTTGAWLLSGGAIKAFAAACNAETPVQTAGPFYPGEAHFHEDNDLTQIAGHAARAEGQVIYVRGRILDSSCQPVKSAHVEIWQACASGRYNNPKDTNTAPLDPRFKYWGEAHTNERGEYEFKSIIPGAYPADTNWTRPPHIHFKVSRLGFKELITQMYFKGNPLNDVDLILLDIPVAERPSVIVEFTPAPAGLEPGSLVGEFDITLASVRRTDEVADLPS